MLEINLLPWRAEWRAKQKKRTKQLLLISFLSAVIFLCLWHFYLCRAITLSRSHLALLQKQLSPMTNQIEDANFAMRQDSRKKEIINAMHTVMRNQEMSLELLQGLARVPEAVSFKKIIQTAGQLHILGVAKSIEDISGFAQVLNQLTAVDHVRIINITHQKDFSNLYFHVLVVRSKENKGEYASR